MSNAMVSQRPSGGTQPWRNWSGAVRFTPARRLMPRSLAELQGMVREVADSGGSLRVAGSGHSFVPLVESGDTLLSLEHLSGIEAISDGAATIWAGTQLKPLGRALEERGYGMLNLGDINKQALAGAVATGTHGTGLGLGSISSQVRSLTLVLPSGETVECSDSVESDLFAAARTAMGSLGVMAKINVALEKAYRLKLEKRYMPFDECLVAAPAHARLHRHFEFYWVPHTNGTLVKFMDVTEEPESNRGMTTAMEIILENGMFGAISRLVRMNPKWAPGMSRLIAKSLKNDQGTMVADCHRAFSTVRLVRFQEMEYELPAATGPDAMRELAEFVTREKIAVHFPVEYRYVKADDIWLSPFYGRDTVAISVHQYVGMEHEKYFRGAEAIFRNHGGRPHWGKMHYLGAKELAPLYPRWDEFLSIREKIDPKGLFLNSFLRRIFGL